MTHPGIRRPLIGLAALAVVALWASVESVRAAGRTYHFDAYRITAFSLPRGYTPAAQLPWPGLLLLAVAPPATGTTGLDGARLVLAAQRVLPGQDAVGMAADARAALLKQGFGDPRVSERNPGPGGEPRSQLDASFDRGRQSMRQLYVVSGDVAVVITVTAPTAALARALREFEAAADSLEIASQAPPGVPAAAPAVDGSAG